jgi:hypothetical protein
VKDATLRPLRCNWLCGCLQICGRTLPQNRQTSQKNRVGVFHLVQLVGLFEGNQDEVKESINEGRVYVDDIVASLECHAVCDFVIGAIIGVSASSVTGYIRNFKRKRIVRIGVCLTTGVVVVEGGIDGNIQEIHLFGDWGLLCLGTLA